MLQCSNFLTEKDEKIFLIIQPTKVGKYSTHMPKKEKKG